MVNRVAYLEQNRAERVGMTADDVLRELAVLGTSDVRRHYQFCEQGIKLAQGAPDAAMRAVSSVKRKMRRIQQDEGPAEESGTERQLDRMSANVRHLRAHGLLRMKEQDPKAS